MANVFEKGKLKPWVPATYRIELQGEVTESFRDKFCWLRITTAKGGGQSTVTTLVGRIRDQAELTGLLNSLYELHMPIISVQHLCEDNGTVENE